MDLNPPTFLEVLKKMKKKLKIFEGVKNSPIRIKVLIY